MITRLSLAAALVFAACAPAAATELLPLSRADIETLPPGAGCSLELDGETLLLAMVDGPAVIRAGAGLVRLDHAGGDLFEGGRFAPAGDGPVVEITLGAEQSRQDYAVARPARFTVDGVAHAEPGEWVCGA